MFGRKTRRIAELETTLADAYENLAVAVVKFGNPSFSQRITVRKGMWYRVSYLYRHDGSSSLEVKDLFVGEEP